MKTYLVFHIVGYTKWNNHPVQGQVMEDKVIIRLIDEEYDNALKRAKKIIYRDNWVLAEVIEYKDERARK